MDKYGIEWQNGKYGKIFAKNRALVYNSPVFVFFRGGFINGIIAVAVRREQFCLGSCNAVLLGRYGHISYNQIKIFAMAQFVLRDKDDFAEQRKA